MKHIRNKFKKRHTIGVIVLAAASMLMGAGLWWGVNLGRVMAAGTSYYVATSGSDANSGSQASPFKTFSKAVSVMAPGDTVHVFGGSYTERLSISKNGAANALLTVKPVEGQKVVIDQGMLSDKGIDITGSYIHVSGIEVKNSKSGPDSGTCVNILGQYNTVSGLVVHDCQGHGIYTEGKHIIISGNTVYRSNLLNEARTSSWGSGIKVKVGGEDILIENNTVYHNYGEGIAVTRGINSIVRGNKVYDN